MGRKSLARERQAGILDAFEECIVEHGLAGSSMQRIAEVLGMDKMMIVHYFGNRETLVNAMIERSVARLEAEVQAAVEEASEAPEIEVVVEAFLFDHPDNAREEAIWSEVTAFAATNAKTRERLRETYDLFFAQVRGMIDARYPNAPEGLRRSTAFAVTVLLDRSGTYAWLGVEGEPRARAREAIGSMLAALEAAG